MLIMGSIAYKPLSIPNNYKVQISWSEATENNSV